MAWYESAVFYHIYPIGLCGCPRENHGEQENHFEKLTQWADHACKINCNAIYIGPLFESVSHGYDTTDYRKVDTRLGTNEDFKQWVSHCHKQGMHVIVDGVFNHVGREFPAFLDVKRERENSQYKDWFCNVNFAGNNEYQDGFSYDNWGGYNALVKLNLWNPKVRQYHFDTVKYWIEEFDIDGIRLDAADVLDKGFMKELRSFCDGVKQDFWLMGEVIHGDYSQYANGAMLYSVTNYELHKGFYSGHNDHNYFEIAHSVRRLTGMCGDTRLYLFSDNHDVDRLASKCNEPMHVRLIAILVYTLYGIPSIYYGSEFAITGKKENGSDDPLRPSLDLAKLEKDPDGAAVETLYTKLGELKKAYAQLTFGGYKELLLTNRQFAYGRILDDTAVLVCLNNDDEEAVLNVNKPVQSDKIKVLLNLGGETTNNQDGIQVKLEANSGMIIALEK